MAEQRQHPRYAVELDAQIVAASHSIAARTHDLSRGGFCVLASTALPVGTGCEVQLALVFTDGRFSEKLRLPATAVWCTPMRGRYQIGIKFGPLDVQNREYLEVFLRLLHEAEE